MTSNRIVGQFYIVLGLCAILAAMFMAVISVGQYNQSQKTRQNEATQASAKAVVPNSEMTAEDPAVSADLLAAVNGETIASPDKGAFPATDAAGAITGQAPERGGQATAIGEPPPLAGWPAAPAVPNKTTRITPPASVAGPAVQPASKRPYAPAEQRMADAERPTSPGPAVPPAPTSILTTKAPRSTSDRVPAPRKAGPATTRTEPVRTAEAEPVRAPPRPAAPTGGFRVARNGQLPGLVAGDVLVSRCGVDRVESASVVRQALIEARESGVPACLNVRQGGELVPGMAVRVPPETKL